MADEVNSSLPAVTPSPEGWHLARYVPGAIGSAVMTVVLLAIAKFGSLVDPKNFLAAAGFLLCVVLLCALAIVIGLRLAARSLAEEVNASLRRHEHSTAETLAGYEAWMRASTDSHAQALIDVRTEVFKLLSTSRRSLGAGTLGNENFGVISEEHARDIEREARQVWVYAFDLKWDARDPAWAALIPDGLAKGRVYKFLLPQNKDVQSRARDMVRRNQSVDMTPTLLQFRIRDLEMPFAMFAVQIYRSSHDDDDDSNTAVVLLPRYGLNSKEEAPTLLISGIVAAEFTREFLDLWIPAKPFDATVSK